MAAITVSNGQYEERSGGGFIAKITISKTKTTASDKTEMESLLKRSMEVWLTDLALCSGSCTVSVNAEYNTNAGTTNGTSHVGVIVPTASEWVDGTTEVTFAVTGVNWNAFTSQKQREMGAKIHLFAYRDEWRMAGITVSNGQYEERSGGGFIAKITISKTKTTASDKTELESLLKGSMESWLTDLALCSGSCAVSVNAEYNTNAGTTNGTSHVGNLMMIFIGLTTLTTTDALRFRLHCE